MAVMMNSIVFGGIDSADYGIYIGGEGVFNAPKRAVEIVTVPGRNGDIVIDQGHWENIKVTYPAFNKEDDLDTFAARLSAFRNALASQVGYQRLTDTFHPDEYRMALFVDGLDVDPVKYTTVGKFNLEFNCKPQRWLTSGEVAVGIASGEELVNPTRYKSEPLLVADGAGTIAVNGEQIEIYGTYLGNIVLAAQSTDYYRTTAEIIFANDKYNDGDDITIQGFIGGGNGTYFAGSLRLNQSYDWQTTDPLTATDTNANFHTEKSGIGSGTGFCIANYTVYVDTLSFKAGTPKTITNVSSMSGRLSGVNYTGSLTATITYTPDYSQGCDRILVELSATQTGVDSNSGRVTTLGETAVNSTVLLDGEDVYIDLELGEAYSIVGGAVVPLNDHVEIPTNLPKLKSGSNLITYDNTITALSITPRWWKL